MKTLLRGLIRILLSIQPVRILTFFAISRLGHSRNGMPDDLAEHFGFRKTTGIPWARNTVPLRSSSIALITTAGYFVKGQPPFNKSSLFGDFGFRVIHRDIPPAKLTLSKYAVDRRLALLDSNMLLPLDRLKELKSQGLIGKVAEQHFSFFCFAANLNRVVDGSAREVARRLRYDGVDKALILTASVMSQNTALLVQRAIEEEGISTVSLSYSVEAIRALKPPRACLVTKGSIFRQEQYLDEAMQMNLLKFMLRQFEFMREPGSVQKVVFEMPAQEPIRVVAGARPQKVAVQKDLFHEI